MPLMAGMFSSPGPALSAKPQAPSEVARSYACLASCTRKAMAQTLGPCSRANFCANESGSAFRMKLMVPWRYSSTFLWRCLATAVKPMRSKTLPMATGSGAAYSMNSKPSVPMGLSQGVKAGASAWLMCGLRKKWGFDE
jgi:hypothetical protein